MTAHCERKPLRQIIMDLWSMDWRPTSKIFTKFLYDGTPQTVWLNCCWSIPSNMRNVFHSL